MKALLINPPTGLYVREDRCQSSVGDFTVAVTRPPMDLMMMASSLEAAGIKCRIKDYPVEGGGEQGFKKDFLSFNPDLLILDILMPDIDGIKLLRQMKEKRPRIPIIMSTAYDYRDDFAVWASEAYIVKSAELTELKATIKKLLEKR